MMNATRRMWADRIGNIVYNIIPVFLFLTAPIRFILKFIKEEPQLTFIFGCLGGFAIFVGIQISSTRSASEAAIQAAAKDRCVRAELITYTRPIQYRDIDRLTDGCEASRKAFQIQKAQRKALQ